ncbi:hypothetical protein R3P38DRAFT_1188886 [Favolaschia claudopus]|uniref:Yeast cell wall synthesis Kre9/Knh1-like N-terminal domain-containing protein n=1 Tax=Favolaschia claudopus TaxID=2862362 RepID=A0AAW0DZ14_9AGAR
MGSITRFTRASSGAAGYIISAVSFLLFLTTTLPILRFYISSSTTMKMLNALSSCVWLTLLYASTSHADVQVEAPVGATSGGSTVIKWTQDPTLPPFDIELVNKDLFHDALAIANSVNASAGMLEVTIPNVAASGGYTLELVNISDIDDVYGKSPEFSIAASVSSTEMSRTMSGSMATGSATPTVTRPVSGSMSTSAMLSTLSVSQSTSVTASVHTITASQSASSSSAAGMLEYGGTAIVSCVAITVIGLVSAVWVL